MVSNKCVKEYVNEGYQLIPPNAKAPRSARKRRSFEKTISEEDDDEMCTIDLLATVAGNLLFESGSPVNGIEDNCVVTQNTVKEEFSVEEKPLKPLTLSEEVVDVKPNVLVSLGSNSTTEAPIMGNDPPSHCAQDDVNLFSSIRDDDENFSGYISPSVNKMSPRNVPRIGDRRIKKILASRHWKGSSRHADAKTVRNHYLHHQRNYPIKKRRYFEESVSDDYRLRTRRSVSSVKGQGASFVSTNSHVRLCIKSFRVPELLVEIPETATVGSLKRMVMEAVNALLSNGHRVGLMVQGKKVRDDNKTLYQTGISHDDDNNHLDSLDFSLEPNSETSLLSGHACEELLLVCQATNIDESAHELAMFTSDSKTLLPMGLTEVSPCKAKRNEQRQQQAARRRIRRPFSVGEVEALVEAVEKIGTGRWRDVKHCAFVDADHRTYVDLKDKWKTLVHTAKISPNQRRGEPVPHELLNRVLNAHGHWSQQHNINNNKQQQEAESVLASL